MMRKALFDDIVDADPYLHKSNHFLMGDTQLWAEATTKAQLHYIPESLATHNITEESATRSKDITKKLRFLISAATLLLYLCDKYNFPSRIRRKHELNWCTYSLELALHTGNSRLADEVRLRKNDFTWREWLRYYGAKRPAIYRLYRIATQVRRLFGEEQRKQWT